MTDREVSRTLWEWALWLDGEMNAAFGADDMADLEARRQGDLERYEQWRRVRESIAHAHPWLKETGTTPDGDAAGEQAMPLPLVERGQCECCGGRWSWTGTAWLISDRAGRAHLMQLLSRQADGPPAPLTRCPSCGVRRRPKPPEPEGDA